ncbi:MAG: ABC transporter ATP-binding protein [Bacteroidota bacterium]|nr:ABC transporter ATP-binding protein [Bacteroidota bacterium]
MIHVKNLLFTYPKAAVPTVKGLSFSVQKGEIYGFLGPSGAGKSTTQKILIKLLSHFDGEVMVLDKRLQDWNADIYEHIGVGFELPNHYLKLTALENLQFFGSFYQKTRNPMHLLKMVGLDLDAHKRVEDFSKGMKMRLNFIRALLHDPQILFLDEPTSGLDPVNARVMKDIILDLAKKGKTIFLTTHNMHDADELCDRVALIVDGEIKETGSPKELKLKGGERKVVVEIDNGTTFKKEYLLDGIGQNREFLELINQDGIQSIHTKEASLEDIFIATTGKKLR